MIPLLIDTIIPNPACASRTISGYLTKCHFPGGMKKGWTYQQVSQEIASALAIMGGQYPERISVDKVVWKTLHKEMELKENEHVIIHGVMVSPWE